MSPHEFTTAPPRESAPRDDAVAPAVFDPLPFCIFTTVALLAWVTNAALIVMIMSALGMLAYGRAIRAGLRTSRCVLGDTRVVMGYLMTAFVAGAVGVMRAL